MDISLRSVGSFIIGIIILGIISSNIAEGREQDFILYPGDPFMSNAGGERVYNSKLRIVYESALQSVAIWEWEIDSFEIKNGNAHIIAKKYRDASEDFVGTLYLTAISEDKTGARVIILPVGNLAEFEGMYWIEVEEMRNKLLEQIAIALGENNEQ